MRSFVILSGRAMGLAVALLSLAPATAQTSGSLAESAGSVGRVLGPQSLGALVSIEGLNGNPQPQAWEFTVADPASRSGVRLLRATPTRANEKPAGEEGYPFQIPTGFFSWAEVKVDAFSAFHAADQEARLAMIGFDSVHYLLRAREGRAAPVWALTLLDAEARPVGRLEISADSGKVERRVWMRYGGPGRRNLIRIEDSLSPYQSMQPAPPPPPGNPAPMTPGSLAPTGPMVPVDPPAAPVYPPIAPQDPAQPVPTIPAPPMPEAPTPAPPETPVPSTPGYTPLPPP